MGMARVYDEDSVTKFWEPGVEFDKELVLTILDGAECIPAGQPVRTGGRTSILVDRETDHDIAGMMLLIPVEMHKELLAYLKQALK